MKFNVTLDQDGVVIGQYVIDTEKDFDNEVDSDSLTAGLDTHYPDAFGEEIEHDVKVTVAAIKHATWTIDHGPVVPQQK